MKALDPFLLAQKLNERHQGTRHQRRARTAEARKLAQKELEENLRNLKQASIYFQQNSPSIDSIKVWLAQLNAEGEASITPDELKHCLLELLTYRMDKELRK